MSRTLNTLLTRHSSGVLWRWIVVRRLSSCLFVLALLPSVELQGFQQKPSEYEVKAAYLYNFGKFVRWPAPVFAGESSFSICIYGQDPFGDLLGSTVTGESIEGKPLSVRRISVPAEAATCRILFVSASEYGRVPSLLAAIESRSVLTVSDMPDFVRRNGMIQFVMQGERVRFEVNLPAAERAGLMLSSELLRVATQVKR